MKYKLKEIPDTVVNLRTQEEWDEYMDMCKESGWRYGNDLNWDLFKENTFRDVSNSSLTLDLSKHLCPNDTVITLEELKKECQAEEAEEKAISNKPTKDTNTHQTDESHFFEPTKKVNERVQQLSKEMSLLISGYTDEEVGAVFREIFKNVK